MKIGKPFRIIDHIDQETIDFMYSFYAPVFVLSTGRCGTKFLSTLLGLSANVVAYHEAKPTLQYFPNFAFHERDNSEILTKMMEACRMELLLETFISEKVYVECNHCLTFFAPAIRDLFAKSRFIHIIRHPGDFVRSAARKGWHRNDSIWESGRIRMANEHAWKKLDQLKRLSWLWATTNGFIEEFKKRTPPDRVRSYLIEDLVSGTEKISDLLTFIGCEPIPQDKIRETQKTRINEFKILPYETPNMRKIEFFPEYGEWPLQMKSDMCFYVSPLSTAYGYSI